MDKFEQKALSEATFEEKLTFATQFLGIAEPGDTDAEVTAKITTAHADDHIWIVPEGKASDQTGSPPPDVERGGITGGLGRGDPKVKLTLHAEERDGVVNNRHKEVGVNGVVWLVKRGESVTIPYRVFLALQNAVRDNITHTEGGDVVHQKVHSVPYSVEEMPSKAEIAAWKKATQDQFAPA